MNEKDLFEAINSISDRYILEAAPAPGKGIRLSRRAAALCAAAAKAVTGAVSAAAIYRARIGKAAAGLTQSTPDETDLENLSKTTLPFKGEVLAESFEDIDFTIDGLTKTHSDRGAL